MQIGRLYVIVALILGGLFGFGGARGWDKPPAPIESGGYDIERPSWRDEVPRPISEEPFLKL